MIYKIYWTDAIANDFGGHFFHIFEIIIFCFVVAICDLVHAVEAMYCIPKVLTASVNLLSNMSDTHETAICSVTDITRISEKVSICL